jgi:hypothetical protein
MVVLDELGNRYDGFDFSVIAIAGTGKSIYPGKSQHYLLLFSEPVAKATQFTCRLPLKAFGQEGWLAFGFPLSSVEKRDLTGDEIKALGQPK